MPHLIDAPPRRRVGARHLEIRTRLVDADHREQREPRHRGGDQRARGRRVAAPPPDAGHDHREHGQQVRKLEPQREAQAELPGGHQPAGEHDPRARPAVAAQQQEERQRDAAARDHVQVAVHRGAERRVGEGHPHHRRGERAQAELPAEQVGARERERVGEHEQQVVASERGHLAVPDQPRRRVAQQRVGEREAVAERPERVRLPEVERVVEQRVPGPGQLPGGANRIAQVLRDAMARVKHQRPAHRHGEQRRSQREQEKLPARTGR